MIVELSEDRIQIHGLGGIVLRTASGMSVTLDASYALDSVVNLFAIKAALKRLGDGAENRESEFFQDYRQEWEGPAYRISARWSSVCRPSH